MTALVNTTIPLDISVYDQIIGGLAGPLKAAPGFRSHACYPTGSGFIVSEIWDSSQDHRAFFDANVGPRLPDGVLVEVTELHNLLQA